MNRIYVLMLITLVAISCGKNKITSEQTTIIDDGLISFNVGELTADWTKGIAIDDIDNVSSIMVYAFLTEGDIVSSYINHQAATLGADGLWGFSPAYYYLIDNTLDFLAYTPQAFHTSSSDNNGLTQVLDLENKKVAITYSPPIVGRNQPDLMLAKPQTGCDAENQLEELSLHHALTQISMSAKVSTDPDDAEVTEENRYVITRFVMHNITTTATLTYSTTDEGIGTWVGSEIYEFITSAMLPDPSISDENGDPEQQVLLTSSYQSIMSNGHTLFMIPQDIETKTTTAPTIQITIYDTIDDVTYRTDNLTLPSPYGAGWIAGDHINLQFEFAISDDNIVIPMTLEPTLLSWVTQTIDKEIDANIYSFLDQDVIDSTVTDLILYTNGVAAEVSCDGVVITSATLGVADQNGYYPITIDTSGVGEGSITVKLENSNNTYISKIFKITVNE